MKLSGALLVGLPVLATLAVLAGLPVLAYHPLYPRLVPPCPPISPCSSSPYTRTVPGSLVSLSWSAPSAQRTSSQQQQRPPPSTPTPSSTRICQPSTDLCSPQSQHSLAPSSTTPRVNGSTTPHVDRLPLSFTRNSSALQPSPPSPMPSTPLPPPLTRTSTQV